MTSAMADANGDLDARFVMPPSTRGLHYVYLTSRVSEKYILAPVDTLPTFTIEPSSGRVGSRVAFRLTGFEAEEQVTVRYLQARGSIRTMALLTTDALGNATGSGVVSSSTIGPHGIEATAAESGVTMTVNFTVTPTLQLQPTSAAPGAEIGPVLRGFGSYESVRLTLQATGATLKTVKVTSLGNVDPSSTTRFRLPSNLAPGTYQIVARGLTSGGTASAPVTVAGAAPAAIPTAVPSPTPAPTQTPVPPTATPMATAVPTTAPTEVPPPEPTANADRRNRRPSRPPCRHRPSRRQNRLPRPRRRRLAPEAATTCSAWR